MLLLRRLLLAGLMLIMTHPHHAAFAVRPTAGITVARAAAAGPGSRELRLAVSPGQIAVGREVTLVIRVTGSDGRPVDAHVTVTGAGNPLVGATRIGVARLTVHAMTTGTAMLQAVAHGYAPLLQRVPVVAGAPGTVAAITGGVTIVSSRSGPRHAAAGSDVNPNDALRTTGSERVSLVLRDGTLIDLNGDTTMQFKDSLHTTLSRGELFVQVVHGVAGQQIRAGTAVVSAHGARFDVRYAPDQLTVVVAVAEGRVLVANRGTAITIGAGQQTSILSFLPPSPPAQVDVTALVSWVSALPDSSATTVPPFFTIPPASPLPVALPAWGVRPQLILSNTISSASISGVVLVTGTTVLPAGARLRVAPGTMIEFGPGALLQVDGVLSAVGQAAAPIVFTSASPFPHPGDWQAVRIENSTAAGSVLSHVHMFYGGSDMTTNVPGMLDIRAGANITVRDSLFALDSSGAISVDDSSRPTIANCSFSGDAGSPINASVNLFGQITGIRLAPTQAPIVARPGSISTSATWSAFEVPLILTGTVALNAGTTLTLAPGTTIAMGAGALFQVDGTLRAAGTSKAPITFTSAATQPQPGDWQALRIENATAAASVLDHVRIFYGGSDLTNNVPGALFLRAGANIVVRNVLVAQDSAGAISVDDSTRPVISHCLFAGDVGSPINVSVNALGQLTDLSLADGQSAIVARPGTISTSTTWQPSATPIVLTGTVILAANVTLTVAPGTIIAMGAGALLQVDGTLEAMGTADAPDVFTSAAVQPKPGDWQALRIENSTAAASILTDVQFLYGGYDQTNNVPGMLFIRSGADVTVKSAVLADDSSGAIYVDDRTRPTLTDLYFAADAGSPINAAVDALSRVTGVYLGAGQAPIVARSGTIQTTQTWQPLDVPVILTGTVTLAAGTTLTIAPGTTVQFGPAALFEVDGTLHAVGTAASPVTFTSAVIMPRPGDWQAFRVENATAGKTVFSHVVMLYGGSDQQSNVPDMLLIRSGANILVTDSRFAQGSNGGVYVDTSSQPTITGNSFAGIAGAAIMIPAADQAFVHGNTFGPGQRGVQVHS